MNTPKQAIEVRYYISNRGQRMKAFCAAKVRWYAVEFLQDDCIAQKLPFTVENCALMAAKRLGSELDWLTANSGKLTGGVLRNGNWVFLITKATK